MKVISIKGRTMIYLFFMVIKLCWQAFLCLKCNLIAIANLGSGCVIETSNLDTDISEMNFVGCKGQTKSWNDVQTSENMQNFELVPKNAFIAVVVIASVSVSFGFILTWPWLGHADARRLNMGRCSSNCWSCCMDPFRWSKWYVTLIKVAFSSVLCRLA